MMKKGNKLNKHMLTSLKQDWKTPKELYKKLDKEFHFDFDPCVNNYIRFFRRLNRKSNGLNCEWGKSNFVNPPYNQILLWLQKGVNEWKKGKTVVFLIPSRTDTKWFHNLVLPYSEIRFIQGRLHFSGYKTPAPFPSMVCIYRKEAVHHT